MKLAALLLLALGARAARRGDGGDSMEEGDDGESNSFLRHDPGGDAWSDEERARTDWPAPTWNLPAADNPQPAAVTTVTHPGPPQNLLAEIAYWESLDTDEECRPPWACNPPNAAEDAALDRRERRVENEFEGGRAGLERDVLGIVGLCKLGDNAYTYATSHYTSPWAYYFDPDDEISEAAARRCALMESPGAREEVLLENALREIEARARDNDDPLGLGTDGEIMADAMDGLNVYEECGPEHIERKLAERLQTKGIPDPGGLTAAQIAHILLHPTNREALWFANERWAPMMATLRREYSTYSHRSGYLKYIRKHAKAAGLYLLMLGAAYPDLPKATAAKLVAAGLLHVDHVCADVTDDPYNFALLPSTANILFGFCTWAECKEELLGEVVWAGAMAFVARALLLAFSAYRR